MIAEKRKLFFPFLQMFRRGGVDDICALLVSVAHEQQEPSSPPSGPAGPQATRAALLPSLTAPGQMQDGSLQATGLDTEAAEQLYIRSFSSFTHSFVGSVVHTCIGLFMPSFVCPFTHSCILNMSSPRV